MSSFAMQVKHESAEFPVKQISCIFHIMKTTPQCLMSLNDMSSDRNDVNDVKNVSSPTITFEERFKICSLASRTKDGLGLVILLFERSTSDKYSKAKGLNRQEGTLLRSKSDKSSFIRTLDL